MIYFALTLRCKTLKADDDDEDGEDGEDESDYDYDGIERDFDDKFEKMIDAQMKQQGAEKSWSIASGPSSVRGSESSAAHSQTAGEL